jgi:hypothetical protein
MAATGNELSSWQPGYGRFKKSTFQRRDKTMRLSTRKDFITTVRFDETIVV